MNQTEAMETVLEAADIFCRLNLLEKGRPMVMVKIGNGDSHNLVSALRKITPRVQRMRARLDFSRAKKAGKQSRPSWAAP